MIGSLRGVLREKQPPDLLVEVGGIGYEVQASMTTCAALPALGEPVHLLTHLVVREDAMLLHGFATAEERQLFRALIRISGVGPRLALTLLSGMSPTALAACIGEGDTARLVKLPGVGRKTAERLVVELRERLPAWADGEAQQGAAALAVDPQAEALAALMALGYSAGEAGRLLRRVAAPAADTAALVRQALQASS